MFKEYLEKIRASGRRSFTLKEATEELNTTENSIKSAVKRLKKKGDIISPARGLYIMVPPEHKPLGCLPAEELVPILMRHLRMDYYVGLLSAGVYHGASHQKPGVFQVIVDKRIQRKLTFGRVCIEWIYKKSLVDLPMQKLTVSTGYLAISSPEVTAMDLLLYPRKSGGLNHIATVLYELVESIDPKKMMALARSSKYRAWVQRLGYILDHIDSEVPENQQIIADTLAGYVASKNPSYIRLASELPAVGYPRCEKWKIIENTTIEGDL